nr:2OG-Fe(II) oxygenase family protein [uncultured Sphingomonas sp.]
MPDRDLTLRLSDQLDPERLAASYAAAGRLHVPNFLHPDDAALLHTSLRTRQDWRLVVSQGERSFDLDRAAQAALAPEQRRQLEQAVHAEARYGFQYLYESIRVPDDEAQRGGGDPLLVFARFLSSPPVLNFLRRVTGQPAIDFADAQATAYGPSHFLTAHDDEVPGKNRHAAYVFNLTPRWRIDWGGLLLFQGADGHVEQGFTPTFNALNLFAVPQPHSVSMVAPFAANRRYSITGWLRGAAGA